MSKKFKLTLISSLMVLVCLLCIYKVNLIYSATDEDTTQKTTTSDVYGGEGTPSIKLLEYNLTISNETNTINPKFKIINTGNTDVDLSKVKIKYYYKNEGCDQQNYWCDWSNIGSSNVTGNFYPIAGDKISNMYFELGFSQAAGLLKAGQSAEAHIRIAKPDWTNYIQNNDYSFNSTATNYSEFNKSILIYDQKPIQNEQPQIDPVEVPTQHKLKITMYNANIQNSTNTIFPRFVIENVGDTKIDLSKLKIRYYYTIDGVKNQNFWCDWSNIGADKITGQFVSMQYPQSTADTYFELGFKSEAGNLNFGQKIEVQIRIAKDDWSNYIQSNDYSFNSSSNQYTYWEKALAFYDGDHIYPDSISFKAPKNLVLTSTSNSIQLTWDKVAGATGYDIEVGGSVIDNGNNTTFVQNGLLPNSQQNYRVRARNELGYCDWTPYCAIATKPAPPTNIKTSSTNSALNISWDTAPGAKYYNLDFDGTNLTVQGSAYGFYGLKPNSLHLFRIRSGNDDGFGEWIDYLKLSTMLDNIQNVYAVENINSIEFSWDKVEGADSYEISLDGVSIAEVTDTSYTVKDMAPGTKHVFSVRAKSSNSIGVWNEKEVSTKLDNPQNLTATSDCNSINAAWDSVEGAAVYDVSVNGQIVDETSQNSYTIKNLNSYSTYQIKIRAKNSDVLGDWSNSIDVMTKIEAPKNIVAASSDSWIKISWDAVRGADEYKVMADGEELTVVGNTYYLHQKLDPNTPHVYRVLAKNDTMQSGWSEAVIKSTKLPTPQNINTEAASTAIKIMWDSVSSATYYDVEFDGILYEIQAPDTYLIVNNLLPNTEHKFRIRARNNENNSEWSNSTGDWSDLKVQNTAPMPPSKVTAATTTNSIELRWDTVLNATYYEVDFDGIITKLDTNNFKSINLTPNSLHSYKVRAVNEWGTSDWTEIKYINTKNEMTFNISEENLFNFVVAIPYKDGQNSRLVTIRYNPDEVDVIDLCAITPDKDQSLGNILGTNFTITKYDKDAGIIEFCANNVTTGVIDSIKFKPKKDCITKLSYSIK